MSFNTFAIKRQAHTLGRQNSSWNPFGLTWQSSGGVPRRETCPEAGLESSRDGADGSPIHHSITAPGALSSNALVEEPQDVRPGSGKDGEAGGRGAASTAVLDLADAPRQPSGDTASGSATTSSTAQPDGLRSRPVPGASSSAGAGASRNVDNGDKEKPKKSSTGIFKTVRPKTPFTVGNQLRRTLLNSWINILLLAAPVGIALNYVKSVDRIAVFVVNFIAIIPLAAMLSFATEEIALRTGETLGGLLNATFGNAVELIVAIMALTEKPAKVVIVQTSLIGSILSNLLLVMGMCFFFGGLRRQEQFFNTTVAQTAASLLALAVASIIVPTVFDHNTSNTSDVNVPALSRGTSVITLIVYGAYLFFQLKTHQTVFSEESQKVPAKPFKTSLRDGAVAQSMVNPAALMGAHHLVSDQDMKQKIANQSHDDDDDDAEEPQLNFIVALVTLTISTVIIALCAEFMVDSIDAVTKNGGLSEEFVGLILLPIVGNAAEHATAVTVAIKDKMDLAIGVAVGSSMQVALFLIPLLVIIGWGMGIDEMTLSFDVFQVAVLFVSVLLVNYLIGDGKSHWLEGMLLICLYFIIAVCSWWYPSPESTASSAQSTFSMGS